MRAELLALDTTGTEREPQFVGGLINWAKIRPLAMRCLVLKRFQTQRYKLIPIPQIQRALLRENVLSESEIEDKIEEIRSIEMRDG
jgi:hypothetical protein